MPKFDEFYKKLKEMQNRYDELHNKYINNDQKKSKAGEKIILIDFDHLSHADFEEMFTLDHILESKLRSYVHLKIIDQIEDVNSYLEEMETETNSYVFIYRTLIKSVRQYENEELENELVSIIEKDKENLTKENPNACKKAVNNFFDVLKTKPYYKEFLSEYKEIIFSNIKDVSFTEPGQMERFFEKNKNCGINLDALSLDEVTIDYDYKKNVDFRPLVSEIIALREENKDDNEYVKVLNDANDIVRKGDGESRGISSNVAERFAEMNDVREFEEVEKKILSEHPKETDLLRYHASNFELKEINQENINAVKNISNSHVVLPDDFKKNLLEIVNKIKKYELFNTDDYEAESQHKVYAFGKLMNKKEAVQDAVLSKNKERIEKAVKDYHETEKNYDELIKDVKSLCKNENFSGNISSAREEEIPAKYRNDHIGASRLSGLWQIMGTLAKYDITMEEFLDNPFGLIDAKMKQLDEIHPMNNCIKDDDLCEAWNKVDGYKPGFASEATNLSVSLYRVFDPLFRMVEDDKIRANLQYEAYLKNAISYHNKFTIRNADLMNYKENGEYEDRMMDILMSEPEDRNVTKITDGYYDYEKSEYLKFDRNQYVKEHKNFESILLRAEASRKSLYGKYADSEWGGNADTAINNSIQKVNELCDKKTELIQDAVDLLNQGKEFKNTMKENLKSVAEFKKVAGNGITEKNIVSSVQVYKELNEKYSHRSLFAKIFYHNVRQQSHILDEYMDAFKKGGFNKNKVNQIMKGDGFVQFAIPEQKENKIIQVDMSNAVEENEINKNEKEPFNDKEMEKENLEEVNIPSEENK